MRLILLLSLFFGFYFSYAAEKDGFIDPSADSEINKIFMDYQKALVTRDVAFPNQSFITDKEFQQLLDYVQEKQPNCVGTDETTFSTSVNYKVYNDLITSKLIINQITVKSIEHNYSCGNLLEIPRVLCDIRYGDKKVVEVPFLLVKTMNKEYKILRNFLSYRLLSNE